MITELSIEGMSCENCVKHVRTALESVDGVERAEVGLAPAGHAVVHHPNEIPIEALIGAVDEEGYGASLKDRRA